MTAQQTPDRDRLRKLAHAATPGPWEAGVDDLTDDITVHHDLEVRAFVAWTGMDGTPYSAEDAEFIAAARTAVPALLDQLDQAEARIQAVRDVLDQHETPHGSEARIPARRIRRALAGE